MVLYGKSSVGCEVWHVVIGIRHNLMVASARLRWVHQSAKTVKSIVNPRIMKSIVNPRIMSKRVLHASHFWSSWVVDDKEYFLGSDDLK